MIKETLKQAGYRYIKAIDEKTHLLQPDQIVDGYQPFMEVWEEVGSSSPSEEYHITYKGRDLFFCRSIII